MEQFFAYHVVTEQPMHVGQHIVFDKTSHNGVYDRVMQRMPIVEEIYSQPEKYYGLELEHHVSVALRELALEEIRKEFFSQYPSRMNCLYVSEDLKAAEQWADYFVSLGRKTYSIVKLKIYGNRFKGDAYKCFDASVNKQDNLNRARVYWENKPNEDGVPPICEIIVDGDIEVVEIVKEIG